MKNNKANICPITGGYKPRRYAVSAAAWKNTSEAQKREWAKNTRPGTLRRYSVRPVR